MLRSASGLLGLLGFLPFGRGMMSLSTTLDPLTFDKLMPVLTKAHHTVVLYVKPKYSYDGRQLTRSLNLASQASRETSVFELEIPKNLDEPVDDSPLEEDEDNPMPAGGDSTAERLVKEERQERRIAKNVVDKFDINTKDMPYISVRRSGEELGIMNLKDETKLEEITKWLERDHGIYMTGEEVDLPDFDLILFYMAHRINAGVVGEKEYEYLIKDAEDRAHIVFGSPGPRWKKMAAYIKTMKAVVKQEDMPSYIDREIPRVQNLLKPKGGSMTKNKRQEIQAKLRCLKTLKEKIAENQEMLKDAVKDEPKNKKTREDVVSETAERKEEL